MRVLLISPSSDDARNQIPPLGLGYISAILKDNGFDDIRFLDSSFLSLKQMMKKIKELKPDIVGVTAVTSKISFCYEIVNFCKELGSLTILGGVHPTILPEECFEKSKVDIVVRGEGEYTMLDITKEIPFENILGISYRNNGNTIHNSDRHVIQNLDSLPFPDMEIFPKLYRQRIPIITSRGCPYRCNYCIHSKFNNNVRFRNIENVVDEIEFMMKKHKTHNFAFMDSTFTLDKQRILRLCELLHERDLNINFYCQTRLDKVDREILVALKNSGCVMLLVGIESGCQRVLNTIDKSIKIEQIKKGVELANEVGLNVLGTFILGHYGDTSSSIRQTINLMKGLNLTVAQFYILTPYPGTEVYDKLKADGKLITEDWERYKHDEVVFRTNCNLYYWLIKAYASYIFRWKFVKDFFRKNEKHNTFTSIDADSIKYYLWTPFIIFLKALRWSVESVV